MARVGNSTKYFIWFREHIIDLDEVDRTGVSDNSDAGIIIVEYKLEVLCFDIFVVFFRIPNMKKKILCYICAFLLP